MEGLERFARLFLDLEVMVRTFGPLLRIGLLNTITLAFGAMAIGLVGGIVIALMGISRRWWVRIPARIYVDVFRGLPAILTILLVGVGLPLSGIRPFGRATFAYAILALGLISTAYIGEIYRAGIQSVERGQMEAARSLGMSYLTAMRLIIIPQGLRRVFPPLTNEFIAITKDTSLVFIIGLSFPQSDLFRIGSRTMTDTGSPSALVMAGLFYLLITVPLTHLVNYMDRRLREGKAVAAEEELPATAVPQS